MTADMVLEVTAAVDAAALVAEDLDPDLGTWTAADLIYAATNELVTIARKA